MMMNSFWIPVAYLPLVEIVARREVRVFVASKGLDKTGIRYGKFKLRPPSPTNT